MDKKDIETFAYKVAKINTVYFEYKDMSAQELNVLESVPDNLKIGIDVEWQIYREKSKIEIDIVSKLVRGSDRLTLFQHTGKTVFGFINLDYFYNNEKGIYDIPNDFVNELNALAYAHSRALLSVELQPTVYRDRFFLPVISADLFIKNLKYTLN